MAPSFQEQLSVVCELQEIDLNLYNLEQALKRLPEKISDLKGAYDVVKDEMDAAKAALEEVEKMKRADESELALSVDHLRTREAKLYAIKTNKEYQAALKEVSEGKKTNREREDRILQSMEKIESLTQKITQLSQEFADKEGAYRAKESEILEEEKHIAEGIKAGTDRRPVILAKLDKEIVHKYDFVRRRHALAIAAVSGGVCQGCSTKLPPQLYNEMLRRSELKACPNCQRLIFVKEMVENQEEDKKENPS